MAKKALKLGTKKRSPQKLIEDNSLVVLRDILLPKNFDVQVIAGNYPATDGNIQLINNHEEYTNLKFDFQSRAINKKDYKKPKVLCDKEFLKSCELGNVPVILFGIDVENKILYWVHLSRKYIKELNLGSQSTKTITFSGQNSLKTNEDVSVHWHKWEEICKAYIENDELIQQMEGLKSSVEINKYVEKEINRFLYKLGKKINSKYYDEIINDFNLLEGLIYYKTETNFPIADFIVNLYSRIIKDFGHQAIYKNKFGDLEGSDYDDFLKKYLDALRKIRYIKTEEVFKILVELSVQEIKPDIKEEVSKLLKDISKFDLFVLEKIGYAPQIEVLNIVKSWRLETKLKNIDAILKVAEELLDLETEGTTMSDYMTLTFTRKSLKPTPALIKLRDDVIKLLLLLFKDLGLDPKYKAKILNVLQKATHFNHSSQEEMVKNDIRKISRFYQQNYDMVGLALRLDMESDLAFINRAYKGSLKNIKKLLNDIKQDELYSLYRLVIGRKIDLIDIDRDFDAITKETSDKITTTIDAITDTNFDEWFNKLTQIAETKDVKDDWEFSDFNNLLEKLSATKPEIGVMIIESSLKAKSPLVYFFPALINGLRKNSNPKYLYQILDLLLKLKHWDFIKSYLVSLTYRDITSLREREIEALVNIANKNHGFSFLKKKSAKELNQLTYSALLNNFNSEKDRVKPLLLNLISSINPDQLGGFMFQLDMASFKRGGVASIDLAKWNKSEVQIITNRLLELKNIDFHIQQLLIEVTKGDLETIVEFFMKRIERREGIKDKPFRSSGYDAIPYDFQEPLLAVIRNNPKLNTVTKLIVSKYKEKHNSSYGFELINLLKLISHLDENLVSVISSMINGSQEETEIALQILSGYNNEGAAISLCLELVNKTDDKDILQECQRIVLGYGGVYSGEHGISESYQAKLAGLETVKTKNKKEVAFIEDLKSYLSKEIVNQREREDKDIEERKREFEMGE